MRYVVPVFAAFLVVATPGCCLQPTPQTRPSEPAVREVKKLPVGVALKEAEQLIPSVEFRKIDGEAFGFVGLIGDHRLTIPTIGRNQDFRLQVDVSVWEEIDSITLSNFRSFIGAPWAADPHQNPAWDGLEITLSSAGYEVRGSKEGRGTGALTLRLETDCPSLWPHRLIVFDVEVRNGEFTFKFVDPWDEDPDFP